jgi:hypothetical protein
VNRHYRGQVVRGIDVPKGTGESSAWQRLTALRKQVPDDVVFDYGDLREWMVIPCRDFQPATLPLAKLRDLLGKDNMRGLILWPLNDDELGSKLLKALLR